MYVWTAISEKWAGQHDVAQIKAAMQDVEYYISSVQMEVYSTINLLMSHMYLRASCDEFREQRITVSAVRVLG